MLPRVARLLSRYSSVNKVCHEACQGSELTLPKERGPTETQPRRKAGTD